MIRSARMLALTLCLALVSGVACTGDDDKEDVARSDTTATREEIKLGAIFDLSGPTRDVGTPYSKGIRDYFEYRNANGGVEGHKLALTFQDFGYKVNLAQQLYQQYLTEGAKAFLGWAADDTDALRPRVTTDKVPYLSAAYDETLADGRLTPFNFFPGISYSQQMRIALQYIANQNKGKGKVEVAVLHHDSPFGTSPLEDGRRYIADKKLDIGFKNYPMPATATDYLAQVGQAKAQGARYIIIQNVAKPAAQLANDLARQKSTAQIICLSWCADELFVTLAKAAAEQVIGVMPFAPPAVPSQGLDEINNFLKLKNTDAAAQGVHYVKGWFTVGTLVEGIANALKANGDKLDGEAIKAGLEQIKDYKTGVSSPISFSTESHAGMKSAALYQVENGTFRKITDPIDIDD
jgi:branched-chain amino acid transport system substrate-binding protein